METPLSKNITPIPWKILPTQQAVLVGQNGSGKSYLARALLRNMPNVIVIDAKSEFEYVSLYGKPRIITNPHELSKIKTNDSSPIYYRPDPDFWDSETYDGVYKWIYTRRNCTVYTDELFAVMGETGKTPHWLNAILTRGRSLKIRSIAATQRPFRIPLTTLSEAKHYFCFKLTLLDDIKRMQEVMNDDSKTLLTQRWKHDYQFWYYDSTNSNNVMKPYIYKKG